MAMAAGVSARAGYPATARRRQSLKDLHPVAIPAMALAAAALAATAASALTAMAGLSLPFSARNVGIAGQRDEVEGLSRTRHGGCHQGLRTALAAAGEAKQGRAELFEAKVELVQLCQLFRAKQEEMWEAMAKEEEAAEPSARAKGGKAKAKGPAASAAQSPSLLEAESFASQRIQLSDELATLRSQTVEAIQRLAALNPTQRPNLGWRGYGGEQPVACRLNGTWKLLFTDAADATFRRGKRGEAATFQEIDATAGWFVNCVDFSSPDSKLRGFRVFVEGEALSDTEMQLSFRKVRLLRRSRIPWLFGEITIPLPNPKLLRNIGRFFARSTGGKVNPSDRGAGFTLLFLDEDLRAHQTFDGLYFVQQRLG